MGLALSLPTRWSSVTLAMESTWLVAYCTEVMWSPRMSMLPLLPLRQRGAFNLLTGVPQASKLESTTNPQLLSQVGIWPRFNVLYACCPTPLLLQRPGLVLTTSLT